MLNQACVLKQRPFNFSYFLEKKKQSDKELNPKSTGNVDMAKYKKEK